MFSDQYTYLWVDLACLIVPLISSFHPKIKFYQAWKSLWISIAIMMLCFIPVDILFTHWGVWGFNSKYTTGVTLINLPIEEWLFFICIPYASVFTYFCLNKFLPSQFLLGTHKTTVVVISGLLLVVAAMFVQHTYTFTYHLCCAILFILCLYKFKANYLNRFLFMYAIILIPFVASNGVLTGLNFWQYPLLNTTPEIIHDQIVWYNNTENLGIRLFSIPLDDIAYGCSMLLLAVMCFEYLENKRKAISLS